LNGALEKLNAALAVASRDPDFDLYYEEIQRALVAVVGSMPTPAYAALQGYRSRDAEVIALRIALEPFASAYAASRAVHEAGDPMMQTFFDANTITPSRTCDGTTLTVKFFRLAYEAFSTPLSPGDEEDDVMETERQADLAAEIAAETEFAIQKDAEEARAERLMKELEAGPFGKPITYTRREARILGLPDAVLSPDSRDAEIASDSIVAACNCMTKAPTPSHHEPGCKNRLIVERDEARAEVAKLKAEVERLEAWKASALALEREWDGQAIARMLDGELGRGVREIVQKRVPEVLADKAELVAGLKTALPHLRQFARLFGITTHHEEVESLIAKHGGKEKG
jgi:hypothetical protein